MTINIVNTETEHAGAMRVRILKLEIENYNGDGEPFGKDEMRMNRIQHVSLTPDGSVFSVGYDYDNYAIVTDLASGESVELTMMVVGR